MVERLVPAFKHLCQKHPDHLFYHESSAAHNQLEAARELAGNGIVPQVVLVSQAEASCPAD